MLTDIVLLLQPCCQHLPHAVINLVSLVTFYLLQCGIEEPQGQTEILPVDNLLYKFSHFKQVTNTCIEEYHCHIEQLVYMCVL